MKVYVISGKARHGKDTVALDIKEIYENKRLKVINLAYGSYIKEYAKRISNWDGAEETKPRELLQELGTDINIRVIRDGYDSVLSEKEQKHLTETALDEYNSYDYVIHNDGTLDDLKDKVLEVVRKVEHEY